MTAALLFAFAGEASEVVRAARWELHSSFWMSLHQTLIDDAMRKIPRELTGLTPEEQATWRDAVASYRTTAGDAYDFTFVTAMVITNDAITQIADDAVTPEIDAPLADTLKKAAPVYRKHWWPADDKVNRFFIGYAAPMLRDAGEELVAAHEKVYGAPFPQRIRAYISPYAGPYGAYTMLGRAGGWMITMSSRDEGYQGLRALEMFLHESSHSVVGPRNGPVARAIQASSQKRTIEPPRDLWHAILFATTSELTRRLLITRGVAKFVPSSEDLLTRAWPYFRAPIETHWLPYVVTGNGTLEEAIDKVIGAVRTGA
jgi:hypothetical protein